MNSISIYVNNDESVSHILLNILVDIFPAMDDIYQTYYFDIINLFTQQTKKCLLNNLLQILKCFKQSVKYILKIKYQYSFITNVKK